MKIRSGFVSNSSASSFILQKEYVTPAQIKWIKNHLHKARKLNQKLDKGNKFYVGDEDEWHIHETETTLEGSHFIDNFDMERYLLSLGIPSEAFEFFDRETSWDDWTAEDCNWLDWKKKEEKPHENP